jgi:hypothetical protein
MNLRARPRKTLFPSFVTGNQHHKGDCGPMSWMPEIQLFTVDDLVFLIVVFCALCLPLAMIDPKIERSSARRSERRAGTAAERFAASVAAGDFDGAERVAAEVLGDASQERTP